MIQKEVYQREKRLDEMRHDFQTTDAQMQTCLASVAHKAKQLQQLDQQLSPVDTSGTVAVYCISYMCFNCFCICKILLLFVIIFD